MSDYHWYKKHGICVECHVENAEQGMTRCLQCRLRRNEKYYEYKASRTEEQKMAKKIYQKAYNHRIYHERKAAGLCVSCKRPMTESGTRCRMCEDRRNALQRQKRQEAAYDKP